MSLPDPEPGLVIRYSFLWSSDALAGAQDGRKDRPAVVVLTVRRTDDATVVLVAPITHSEPPTDQGVELPVRLKQQIGLDDERSWIVTSELNEFVWPGPDLRRIPGSKRFYYGYLPERLVGQVRRLIMAAHSAESLRRTPRS